MAKVLLVSANTAVDPYPVYPLGMATVARALVNAGHEVSQYDVLADGADMARLFSAIRAFGPDAVGVSLRNVDNVDSFSAQGHWWVAKAREIVETARAASKGPVFMGGAGFSLLPQAILEYTGADFGVVGEGESAVVEVMDILQGGAMPPRLYRSPLGPLGGGEFAPPLLDERLLSFYNDRTGIANYQTKRGCPHACSYCTYPTLEGGRFRVKDPVQAVDEMAWMMSAHNVTEIFFTDSVFNDAAGNYLNLVEELVRRGLGLKWGAFFRPQGLGEGEVALMKRAGLFAMELGTDAASDATLSALDKGFTFAEVAEVNRACVAQRVPCSHFVIFGGPGETEATVEEGLQNIEALESTVVFAFSGIRILPNTKVAALALAQGVIREGDPLLMPVFYHSPSIDRDRMNERITAAFKGRRDRVFPPDEGHARMSVMMRFGYKGLLWDRLIDFDKPSKPRKSP